ncbi:MAG: YlbF family regulator [Halobacteriaceae archaeon]
MSLDPSPLDLEGSGEDAEPSERDAGAEDPPDADVDALAAELGEAIAGLPVYRAFERARAAVAADEDLQEQIAAFERRREEFAAERQQGTATREDAEELRRAQEALHADPTMAAFLQARDRLRDRLEELNRAVSDPLAVDFGGEAGGCCQD